MEKTSQHLRAFYLSDAVRAAPHGNGADRAGIDGTSPLLGLTQYRITGVDWAQVNGIDVNVAQTVIAEVGVDLREFPSERNFASWLGLSPTNETSGGKVLSRRTRHVANRLLPSYVVVQAGA